MAKHFHIHVGGKAKDANPDGTISPDEDRREADLGRKVITAVVEFKREAYDIGGSFRGPGIWSRVKRLLARDASNHLGEKEYYTFRRWKEAIKAAYPNARFEGNEEMCNAVPGGDWDGEKGCVYAKRTDDAVEFKPMDNQLLQKINQALTQASRDAETLVANNREGDARGMAQRLESLIDEARNYCFSLRR